MKKSIQLKSYSYLIIALLMLLVIDSCKKGEETPEPKSLSVNISFTSDLIKPEAGQTLVVNLYYQGVTGTSIINSSPDMQEIKILAYEDVTNGMTITFEDIIQDAEYVYVGAYVDIDENGALNAGDLAAFYKNVSLEDVELNQAVPTNLAGIYNINLDLNIIFAEDELAIDIDNNIYKTVIIGDQEWFAENLKTTKFRNGDDIPTGYTAEEWEVLINPDDGTGTPAYAQNPEALPEDGLLYNWYAVADDREVCPTGWRSPTEDDWIELMMYAGMSEEEANDWGWQGEAAEVGKKLKSQQRGMNGTDIYGFNALPSGMRSTAGTFSRYDIDFFFWSASEDPTGDEDYYMQGVRRAFRNSLVTVVRQDSKKTGGYAVRCVRDVSK